MVFPQLKMFDIKSSFQNLTLSTISASSFSSDILAEFSNVCFSSSSFLICSFSASVSLLICSLSSFNSSSYFWMTVDCKKIEI